MGAWQVVAAMTIGVVLAAALWLLRSVDAVAADARAAVRRPRTWVVGVPSLALVLLVGVPWVYVRAISTTPPPPLSLDDLPVQAGTASPTTSPTSGSTVGALPAPDLTATTAISTSTSTSGTSRQASSTTAGGAPVSPVAGAWAVGAGTEARYDIDDTALGHTEKVVGRTNSVTGTMQIVGMTVAAVHVVVDMRSVRCGCIHDSKYQELMETSKYPTSTFELTTPIALASIPADGVVVKVPVTGRFTIHGVTRQVSFTLSALRRSGTIAVNGLIPVKLEDYNISSPNAGPFGGLSNAAIELLVVFHPAG